jgi:hypothetical protein
MTNGQCVLLDHVSLLLKKLQKLPLAYGLAIEYVIMVLCFDGGIAVRLGNGLLEAEATGDAVGILLEELADVPVDNLVPPVHDTSLY